MALAGIASEEFIHHGIAAIKSLAIMVPCDRLLVPAGKRHVRLGFGLGSAAMAARSLAFGAGGFSSRSRTMRLSRSDRTMRSASSITALAFRKAGCRTKSVRSVFFSAAARMSVFFLFRPQPEIHSLDIIDDRSRHGGPFPLFS